MQRWWPWLLLAGLLIGLWLARAPELVVTAPGPAATTTRQQPASDALPQANAPRSPTLVAPSAARLPGFLPPEAQDTITLIQRGGPFPHRQDGGVFGNREGRLPRQPRGWYREYTVDTPGVDHRGARRIVTGGRPPSDWYYTGDHYDSFRRFDPGSAGR